MQPIVDVEIALARVYTAVAGHRWDHALPVLEAISPVAQKYRLVREVFQLHILTSLALEQEGEDVTARLQETANLTESRGLKRLAADTHPTYVEQLAENVLHPLPTESHPRIQPAADPTGTPSHVVENSLLRPKETDVLQLLAGNLTNKQIASAMGVGDQTVKWHLKNMFTKLQAGSHKHLIGRARMLGIME